jgi:hypothetical protein
MALGDTDGDLNGAGDGDERGCGLGDGSGVGGRSAGSCTVLPHTLNGPLLAAARSRTKPKLDVMMSAYMREVLTTTVDVSASAARSSTSLARRYGCLGVNSMHPGVMVSILKSGCIRALIAAARSALLAWWNCSPNV